MLASKLAPSVSGDAEALFSRATGRIGRSGNANRSRPDSLKSDSKCPRSSDGRQSRERATRHPPVVSLLEPRPLGQSGKQRMVTNDDGMGGQKELLVVNMSSEKTSST